MRKSYLFAWVGFFLGVSAPLGAILLLWFSPHPALRLPSFIVEEWEDHLFFFTYMLVGTSLAFALFGYILGHNADRLITENQDLSNKVLTDPLTGLGNHRFLHDAFKIEFRRHLSNRHPLSCLMMDLDRFKRVNDRHGHPFGDYVLKHFSMVVKKSIRQGDTATRYGGEEFLCILPDCGMEEAFSVAERIRKETENYPFMDGEKRVKVTVSVGSVTGASRTGESYHRLIAVADQALYEAKRRGRNRVVQLSLDRKKKTPVKKSGRKQNKVISLRRA
jgi:diguanylate cyclase (GGDEF)-like protein